MESWNTWNRYRVYNTDKYMHAPAERDLLLFIQGILHGNGILSLLFGI